MEDVGNSQGPSSEREEQASRTLALKFVQLESTTKVPAGKRMAGRTRSLYACTIKEGDKVCGSHITVYGKSTSSIFKHVRRFAARADQKAHSAALEELNKWSSRQVRTADGEWTSVFSFSECFPHHLDFCWLVAGGLPMRLNRRAMFLDFVRGFEPRAVLPHNETVHRIVECVDELQQEDLARRIARAMEASHGLECFGLQLDLWTDRNSSLCYVALHLTTIAETENSLELHDDLLDFSVFPFTSHTGENLKTWLLGTLKAKDIPLKCISGVTPDGAADGRKAFNLITELRSKVDICGLHQLQRSVLYSVGEAGPRNASPNMAARDLLRQHRRVVQLSHQSREISHAFRDAQQAAGVPPHKIIGTVRHNVTRWGNQLQQVSRNNLMRPIQDPVITKYKREHISEVVLLETSDKEGDSDDEGSLQPTSPFAVPRNITRREVGLDSAAWEASLQLESFLERPFQVKELVENCATLTGGQMIFLMASLRSSCSASRALIIKNFPPTAALKDRKRSLAEISADSIHPMILRARVELEAQLEKRFFSTPPSETRLVQLYMSKQADAAKIMPVAWLAQAKAFYLVWLRRAAVALKVGTRVSPERVCKKRRVATMLFDGFMDAESEATASPSAEEAGTISILHV